MSRTIRSSALAAVFVLATPFAALQSQVAAPSTHAAARVTAAPRSAAVAPAPVAARRTTATEDVRAMREAAAQRVRAQAGGSRQGRNLMIIGGAAFIAGAVIGGDAGTIVMLGGAGVGLYGLYLYL